MFLYPYDLSVGADKIALFNPDTSSLWPGALIQGRSLPLIGSLQELAIKKRAPINLSISTSAPVGAATVNKPTLSSVQDAMSSKLIFPMEGKEDFGAAFDFVTKETYDASYTALSVGVSAKHSEVAFSAKHSEVSSATNRVVTAFFIQRCFTITMDSPSRPVDLFSDDSTIDDILEQERAGNIGKKNVPVFLSSVTYGRIAYLTISSSESFTEIKNAISASASSGLASAAGTFNDAARRVLRTATKQISGIGLEQKAFVAALDAGDLSKFFAVTMDARSAMPISYVFKNLNDLSIAAITDTAHYDITVCGTEKIDAEFATVCNMIDAKLKQFPNFVRAASDNTDDPPTRRLRTIQYREMSFNIVRGLNDLYQMVPSLGGGDSDLRRDYIAWLKQWTKETIKKVKIVNSDFDFFASQLVGDQQAIYSEGRRLSDDHLRSANDLLDLLMS
jgi:Thiol-activated cytolysin